MSAFGYWVGGERPRRRPGALVVRYGWHPWRAAEWNPLHAPHLMVSGPTGWGKSTTLRTLLASLPRIVVPWRVVVLDPKGGADWSDLRSVAHVATTSSDIVNTCAWLWHLLDEHATHLVHARARSWVEYVADSSNVMPLWPTVVVVDEAVDAFGGLGLPKADATVVVNALGRIVRQGRSLGVVSLLSMLRPDAAALGPQGGLLRAQLGGRVALGPGDSDSRRMLGLSDDPPHLRRGRGFGIALGTDPTTEMRPASVRVPHLDDDLVVELLARVTDLGLTGPPTSDRPAVDP